MAEKPSDYEVLHDWNAGEEIACMSDIVVSSYLLAPFKGINEVYHLFLCDMPDESNFLRM